MITIDEEHELSYKQDETPRYHTRDLAIQRSKYHHCSVVLGSATSSLESKTQAQKGVCQLLQLNHRARAAAQLPVTEIVGICEEFQDYRTSTLSVNLQEKMQSQLDKKGQTVLLLNRREYPSFAMCRDCGSILPCPNCDVSLTLHVDIRSTHCHHCRYEEPIPNRRPNCGDNKIRYYRTGIQKVEEKLRELHPRARILRMDADTTRRKGAHEQILQKFGTKEVDVLLGTQTAAKGLDFPEMILAGALNADISLNLPDFRSSEHMFQLLTQVSGRAGRAGKADEVVTQTFNPQHYAIELAKKRNYEQSYQQEMHVRHRGDYPLYHLTMKITANHPEEQVAARKVLQAINQLKEVLSPQDLLLGPTPSVVLRVKSRYCYQLIIKYKYGPNLPHVLGEILNGSQKEQRQGPFVITDNEPLNFI